MVFFIMTLDKNIDYKSIIQILLFVQYILALYNKIKLLLKLQIILSFNRYTKLPENRRLFVCEPNYLDKTGYWQLRLLFR